MNDPRKELDYDPQEVEDNRYNYLEEKGIENYYNQKNELK